jgi:hypothetical protein
VASEKDRRDYLDADGWPLVERGLQLLQLLEDAALTSRLNEQERLDRYNKRKLADLVSNRNAMALQLSLPAFWHFAPVRSYKLPNVPKGYQPSEKANKP